MLHCFQRTHRQHFLVVKWAKKPEILEKSLEACPSALQIPSICSIDHVRHVLRTHGRSGKFILITLPISSFYFYLCTLCQMAALIILYLLRTVN